MTAPSFSITAIILTLSSSLKNFAAWYPTFANPFIITFLPSNEPLGLLG